MQFTAATLVLIASTLSTTWASTLIQRGQTCGVAPSGSGSQTPLSQPSAATAEACYELAKANSACKSFVFGLPPSASAPTCKLFSVAGAKVPKQGTNLKVYDIACSDIPNTAPTTANPQGTYDSSNSDSNSNSDSDSSNICGSKPTGSGNAQTPLKTDTSIDTAAACLSLCQATSSCECCEFGRPSANGALQCLLFSVPASDLPAPDTGATFVAYDCGC